MESNETQRLTLGITVAILVIVVLKLALSGYAAAQNAQCLRMLSHIRHYRDRQTYDNHDHDNNNNNNNTNFARVLYEASNMNSVALESVCNISTPLLVTCHRLPMNFAGQLNLGTNITGLVLIAGNFLLLGILAWQTTRSLHMLSAVRAAR